MFEIRETSPSGDLKYGTTTVGPTPVPVTPNSVELIRGLLLRAPGSNDVLTPNVDCVFVGLASVTPGTNQPTDGFPLTPGASIELPVSDPSKVFLVSQTPGQLVSWMGV